MITRLFAPSRGLVGLASFLVACASAGGMRAEPLDVGVLREFNGDYTTVLRATRNAVASAGLAVDSYEEVNDSTAMIVAKKGNSAWSWGELAWRVSEGDYPLSAGGASGSRHVRRLH